MGLHRGLPARPAGRRPVPQRPYNDLTADPVAEVTRIPVRRPGRRRPGPRLRRARFVSRAPAHPGLGFRPSPRPRSRPTRSGSVSSPTAATPADLGGAVIVPNFHRPYPAVVGRVPVAGSGSGMGRATALRLAEAAGDRGADIARTRPRRRPTSSPSARQAPRRWRSRSTCRPGLGPPARRGGGPAFPPHRHLGEHGLAELERRHRGLPRRDVAAGNRGNLDGSFSTPRARQLSARMLARTAGGGLVPGGARPRRAASIRRGQARRPRPSLALELTASIRVIAITAYQHPASGKRRPGSPRRGGSWSTTRSRK